MAFGFLLVVAAGWHVLPASALDLPAQHRRHAELFSAEAPEFNRLVLQGIDRVQGTAMDGGGYFTGVRAQPTESPIGYPLSLAGQPLLAPPRQTSFCTGASYSAFIEAMNLWLVDDAKPVPDDEILSTDAFPRVAWGSPEIPADRLESLRLQELDGGRREDHVKFWGQWNADGFGNDFALVQYSGIGTRVAPQDARPGDFMNISWKSGLGHSTVFLGWCLTKDGQKAVRYWSSQKGTNGLGDAVARIDSIVSVCVVRVIRPERIKEFDVNTPVEPKVVGDKVDW